MPNYYAKSRRLINIFAGLMVAGTLLAGFATTYFQSLIPGGILIVWAVVLERWQARKQAELKAARGPRASDEVLRRGIPVLDAPRFYPSSKTCSHCGAIKADLGSSETYSCKSCGCTEDRDHNAAKNLAALWVKTTVSSTVAACGDFSSGCGRVSDISETGVSEARTEQRVTREMSQLALVSEN